MKSKAEAKAWTKYSDYHKKYQKRKRKQRLNNLKKQLEAIRKRERSLATMVAELRLKVKTLQKANAALTDTLVGLACDNVRVP